MAGLRPVGLSTCPALPEEEAERRCLSRNIGVVTASAYSPDDTLGGQCLAQTQMVSFPQPPGSQVPNRKPHVEVGTTRNAAVGGTIVLTAYG